MIMPPNELEQQSVMEQVIKKIIKAHPAPWASYNWDVAIWAQFGVLHDLMD